MVSVRKRLHPATEPVTDQQEVNLLAERVHRCRLTRRATTDDHQIVHPILLGELLEGARMVARLLLELSTILLIIHTY